ncbi:MAG: hypothetical protein ACQERE_06410, partial [Pseudomonadota bacterium]
MQSLTIGYLAHTPDTAWSADAQSFSTVDALLRAGPLDVILVDLEQEDAADAVFLIRCDRRYRLTLILSGRGRSGSPSLSDGLIPEDPRTITSTWQRLQQRLAAFNQGRAPERFDEFVLAWL